MGLDQPAPPSARHLPCLREALGTSFQPLPPSAHRPPQAWDSEDRPAGQVGKPGRGRERRLPESAPQPPGGAGAATGAVPLKDAQAGEDSLCGDILMAEGALF